MKINYF